MYPLSAKRLDEIDYDYNKLFSLWLIIVTTVHFKLVASPLIFFASNKM